MFRERTLALLRPALTLIAVLIAAGVLWQLYLYYTYAPQTRDGKIRADVVPLATDVSGKVEAVHIHDNRWCIKGSCCSAGQSTAAQRAGSGRGRRGACQRPVGVIPARKPALSGAAVGYFTTGTRQSPRCPIAGEGQSGPGSGGSALARINLQRADLYAPVDGVITNFSLRPGAYATAGQPIMALVDSNSFYIAGYFEETKLGRIQNGDKVVIRIMGNGSRCMATSTGFPPASTTASAPPPPAICSPTSTRHSAGSVWRSASRCASRSTPFPTASS